MTAPTWAECSEEARDMARGVVTRARLAVAAGMAAVAAAGHREAPIVCARLAAEINALDALLALARAAERGT